MKRRIGKLCLHRLTIRDLHAVTGAEYQTNPVRVTMDIDCITEGCATTACGGGGGTPAPSFGGPSGCVECLTK